MWQGIPPTYILDSRDHSILLDKPYKTQLETIYAGNRLYVPKSRYDVLLKQRHINLLGKRRSQSSQLTL